jgi:hypothetical protein
VRPGRPLRNRVTPSGDIVATPHRGTKYGNRGVLHDDRLVVRRRFQVRRWLVCEVEFRGRRRPVLQPGRYTELFFLDEAVALAAGHRPCAECRNRAYKLFQRLWPHRTAGGAPPGADAIDTVLHGERALVDECRLLRPVPARELPDGVFAQLDNGFWLLHDGRLHRWSHAGYQERRPLPRGDLPVLTPPSTVATLAAGYRPDLHPSAVGR